MKKKLAEMLLLGSFMLGLLIIMLLLVPLENKSYKECDVDLDIPYNDEYSSVCGNGKIYIYDYKNNLIVGEYKN